MTEADYLSAKVERDGVVCVLAVSGELDLLTVARFADCAATALKAHAERFVLDLSGLRFTDCCGARALAATAQAVPAGCPVIVRSVRPAVRRVLGLLGQNLESRALAPGSRADRLGLSRSGSAHGHGTPDSRATGWRRPSPLPKTRWPTR